MTKTIAGVLAFIGAMIIILTVDSRVRKLETSYKECEKQTIEIADHLKDLRNEYNLLTDLVYGSFHMEVQE